MIIGIEDKNGDGKLDSSEIITGILILVAHAGYYVRPLTDEDIKAILDFFQVTDVEMLKSINLSKIIHGLVELGLARRKK
ncbi:MAG: hypothetical protein ACRDCW_02660 [Sarcina sp.]